MKNTHTKKQSEQVRRPDECELHRKFRPARFSEVLGQEESVSLLQNKGKAGQMPHSILFSGPPGVGKTTLSRLVAKHLHCVGSDLTELNNADYTGIDAVREVRRSLYQAPLFGRCRVYILDECHRLTSAAQSSLLKIIEEPPSHIYFFLCTTDPDKLLGTIVDRCMHVRLRALSNDAVDSLLTSIAKEEGIQLSPKVRKKIVEYNTGSARAALASLDKIRAFSDEKSQLALVEQATMQAKMIDLARKLINPSVQWMEVARILKTLEDEEPEQIRILILHYAKTALLGGPNHRAFFMLNAFERNFYDSKFAGVVAACYQVVAQE